MRKKQANPDSAEDCNPKEEMALGPRWGPAFRAQNKTVNWSLLGGGSSWPIACCNGCIGQESGWGKRIPLPNTRTSTTWCSRMPRNSCRRGFPRTCEHAPTVSIPKEFYAHLRMCKHENFWGSDEIREYLRNFKNVRNIQFPRKLEVTRKFPGWLRISENLRGRLRN